MPPTATAIALFRQIARGVAPLAEQATESLFALPGFLEYPGSIERHHCFPGGLLQHTLEVVRLACTTADLAEEGGRPVDRLVIFLAAAAHDVGKIWAYERTVSGGLRKCGHFTNTLHTELGMRWVADQIKGSLDAQRLASVIHCIAAHHGRPEYGALCEPETPEAWAVHLADMQSALCIGGRKNHYVS